MAIFQFSKIAAAAILHFQILEILTVGTLKMAKLRPCQILSKSVKLWPRYGNFSILQDSVRRHLGFSKFETFNGGTAPEGRTASPEIAQTAAEIW